MNAASQRNDTCGYPPGLADTLPPGLPPHSCLTPAQIVILTTLPPPALSASKVISILMYIYSAGIAMNGLIILAIYWNHKRLLKTTMDRITCGLVSICFIWSVGRTVFHKFQSSGTLTLQNVGAAAFCVMVICIFCLNAHLAMERFFQVKSYHSASRLYYAGLYSFSALSIGIVVWMFASSTTFDGIKPDGDLQRTAWVVVASSYYAMTVTLIASCYFRTYRFYSKKFEEIPELVTVFMSDRDDKHDPEALELVRNRIERQILARCLMLSLSLVICYAPFYSYQMRSYAYGFLPLFDPTGLYYDCSVIMLAADVVITPLLVFLFRKEVREVFVWTRQGTP
ncbi:hypothetical protein HDU98_005774 [Podochytrium sp. JEL0797]|nr:hypothetical protein HDU98_005774 [Podochytrium sp. JEL0797]